MTLILMNIVNVLIAEKYWGFWADLKKILGD